MEINIKEILDWGESIEYVILRNSTNVLNSPRGSDIDILTNNKPALTHLFLTGLIKYGHQGYVIKKTDIDGHTHIDVIDGNELIIRFDLIDGLSLEVSKNVVKYILDNREKRDLVYVPSAASDIFTRMLEYFNNPNKTKHIKYVESRNIK